jgi:hypothetical protein
MSATKATIINRRIKETFMLNVLPPLNRLLSLLFRKQ